MAVKIEMEMPVSCIYCRFLICHHGEEMCVAIDEDSHGVKDVETRPEWCPLKEVSD